MKYAKSKTLWINVVALASAVVSGMDDNGNFNWALIAVNVLNIVNRFLPSRVGDRSR